MMKPLVGGKAAMTGQKNHKAGGAQDPLPGRTTGTAVRGSPRDMTKVITCTDEAKKQEKYLHQRKAVATKGRELQKNQVAALIGTITIGITRRVHMRADTHTTGVIASADGAKNWANYLHQRKTLAMKRRELQTNLVAALIGTITIGITGRIHMRADTLTTGRIHMKADTLTTGIADAMGTGITPREAKAEITGTRPPVTYTTSMFHYVNSDLTGIYVLLDLVRSAATCRLFAL